MILTPNALGPAVLIPKQFLVTFECKKSFDHFIIVFQSTKMRKNFQIFTVKFIEKKFEKNLKKNINKKKLKL